MRLYMFTSEPGGLSAFCADVEGSKLPKQFAPWMPIGFVENGAQPPHNFSRIKIENSAQIDWLPAVAREGKDVLGRGPDDSLRFWTVKSFGKGLQFHSAICSLTSAPRSGLLPRDGA